MNVYLVVKKKIYPTSFLKIKFGSDGAQFYLSKWGKITDHLHLQDVAVDVNMYSVNNKRKKKSK